MKINVAEIREAPGETFNFSFHENLPPLVMDDQFLPFHGPVDINVNVTNTGRALLVKGRAKGKIEVPCGRCLELFRYDLEASFEEEYCHLEDIHKIAENKKEEEKYVVFDNNLIDITDPVKDSLYLALPMKFTCVPECKGICPHCGRNLNNGQCDCKVEETDPRLEVLKKFFKD